MAIDPATGHAAAGKLAVVLEVDAIQLLAAGHATDLADAVFHIRALLRRQQQIGRGIDAHGHIVEVPREDAALGNQQIEEVVACDDLIVLARIADGHAERDAVAVHQLHRVQRFLEMSISAAAVVGFLKTLDADGNKEVPHAQHLLTEFLVDERAVGKRIHPRLRRPVLRLRVQEKTGGRHKITLQTGKQGHEQIRRDLRAGEKENDMLYSEKLRPFAAAHPCRTIDVDGAQFRYILTGKPEVRTRVFLNGGMNTLEMWMDYVDALADTGRVLLFDYPQQLRTNQALVAGMHAFFAALKGKILLILPDQDFFSGQMQQDLIRLMHEPEIRYVSGGHLSTVLKTEDYIRTIRESLPASRTEPDTRAYAPAKRGNEA